MESLNRMRAHRKKLDADEVLHPISGEESALGEHERTLGEIFADKEQQNLFLNKFLFEQDSTRAQEIADALADDHVLTDKQDKWMESQRKAFNMRSFEVEQVKEMLQGSDMEHLADLNPNIRLILGKIGKEKAAEFLGNEFGQLAFADSKAFKKMLGAMKGIHTGFPRMIISTRLSAGPRSKRKTTSPNSPMRSTAYLSAQLILFPAGHFLIGPARSSSRHSSSRSN